MYRKLLGNIQFIFFPWFYHPFHSFSVYQWIRFNRRGTVFTGPGETTDLTSTDLTQ